jgi:hypothetical protein
VSLNANIIQIVSQFLFIYLVVCNANNYPLFIEELLHVILRYLQFVLVVGHFFVAKISAINNGFLKLIKNCQSICEGTEKLKEI